MHKCQPLWAFIPASPSLPPLAALHSFTGSSPPKKNKTKIKLLCVCFPALYPIHYYSHTSLFLPSRLYSPHCFTHSFPSISPPLHRYCTVLQQACLTSPLFLFHCLFFLPISLLGDPLVTSSLLQLPWFLRGEKKPRDVITVWIRQTFFVPTHSWRESKEILFYYRNQGTVSRFVWNSCVWERSGQC